MHIARPAISLPDHMVTTSEMVQDLKRADPGTSPASLRILQSTTVKQRYMTRPLGAPTVGGRAAFDERNSTAFQDATRLAVSAAQQALRNASISATDVDYLITSHTTSWSVPGLDVALVNELGLRPHVRRIPMTSVGCAGGAQALTYAQDCLLVSPGARVLVVVAECLSAATYNPAHTSVTDHIYKGLFGDSGAAVVVSGDQPPASPSVLMGESFTYVLPGSVHRYEGALSEDGLRFVSDRTSTKAVQDAMPAIQKWLQETGSTRLDWAAVHPGGPRILADVAAGLSLDPAPETGHLRHSWRSLAERGNLGGAAVLDVLAGFFDQPPGDGEHGLVIGFGPGFAVAATRCTWRGQ
ncbi:PhlD [Streptomyces sp. 372A]